MLKEILAIAGKPGLYKFLSRGNRMLIVETIDDAKKRMPAYATDQVVALSDISIYTDDGGRSAQWEYTLLMTEEGLEILSK